MSLLLFSHVSATVVGARNRDLEVMLSSVGIRTSPVPAAELAALSQPAARPAPVVIVDLRDGELFPPLLAQLKRQHPQTAIVVVAKTLDPALMLEAMRAGVSECLVEPLSESDLRDAIARVGQHAEAPSTGQVFAVIGAKGGVGATTVSVNLAAELAKVAHDATLLIDLHHCQGDAAVMLGVEPRFTVVDALQNAHRLDEAVFRSLVTSTRAGVQLLASPRGWRLESVTREQVRTLVGVAARLFRYVVVDVPRSDPSAIEVCGAATRLVVVANQELTTIRQASSMVGTLRERCGAERVSVVVNRFDPHAEITRNDVGQVVKDPIRHVIPSDYRAALRAQHVGRPMTLDDRSKIAAAFHRLAHDLAELEAPQAEAAPATGFFGRLGGRRS
jgi:pilus assembly protein CpaE